LIYQQVRFGLIKMDLYPIILYFVMICYRIFIISIRHATTPPRVYRDLFISPISVESLGEGLAFASWAEISEENITKELGCDLGPKIYASRKQEANIGSRLNP
jgi:hypothetical protein